MDSYTITSYLVQLLCVELKPKEELNFERCADVGADDGDGKVVTIRNLSATWAYLSGDRFWTAAQSINLPNRTIWEFEKYKDVDILEYMHVMIRQTE